MRTQLNFLVLYAIINLRIGSDLMESDAMRLLLAPMKMPERLLVSSFEQTVEMDVLDESPSLYIPDDCLAKSLEYLCHAKDFCNFRRTSHRFNGIYHQFSQHVLAKFLLISESDVANDSDNLHQCKFRFVSNLLQFAQCISEIYVDIHLLQRQHHLFQIQQSSRMAVLRGLDINSKRPFLSLLLRNLDQMESALLICVFNVDHQSTVQLIVWSSGEFWSKIQEMYPDLRCNVSDINEIIRQNYIGFPLEDCATRWILSERGNLCCHELTHSAEGRHDLLRLFVTLAFIGYICAFAVAVHNMAKI